MQLLSPMRLSIMVRRLAMQIAEGSEDLCLIGLQPRGIALAERLHPELCRQLGKPVPLGRLDITFFRDDVRSHASGPLKANATAIDFITADRRVVLVDDVLYTGRSVRAALDAINAFGRPATVEFACLIDRRFARELPLEATYTGLAVDTIRSQRVVVDWQQEGVFLMDAATSTPHTHA